MYKKKFIEKYFNKDVEDKTYWLKYKNKNMPNSFFKYTSAKYYIYDLIYDDLMFLPEINELNDPFEIQLFYDIEKIKTNLYLKIEKLLKKLLEKKLVLYQKHEKFIKNDYFDNLQTENIIKFKEIIKKGKAGGTPKSTNKEYYGGEIPFLSINDMTSQGKYITKTEKSITEKGLDNSSAWIVPKNSLLYSIYASIGFVSINKIDLTTSQAIYGIILKENVNQDFVYHYLKDFKRYIHKYIETGTQGNLNSKIVQNIEIKLPFSEEQNYYSNLFNILDYKIEVAETEIHKLKIFKKGLLQKMFV